MTTGWILATLDIGSYIVVPASQAQIITIPRHEMKLPEHRILLVDNVNRLVTSIRYAATWDEVDNFLNHYTSQEDRQALDAALAAEKAKGTNMEPPKGWRDMPLSSKATKKPKKKK